MSELRYLYVQKIETLLKVHRHCALKEGANSSLNLLPPTSRKLFPLVDFCMVPGLPNLISLDPLFFLSVLSQIYHTLLFQHVAAINMVKSGPGSCMHIM